MRRQEGRADGADLTLAGVGVSGRIGRGRARGGRVGGRGGDRLSLRGAGARPRGRLDRLALGVDLRLRQLLGQGHGPAATSHNFAYDRLWPRTDMLTALPDDRCWSKTVAPEFGFALASRGRISTHSNQEPTAAEMATEGRERARQ